MRRTSASRSTTKIVSAGPGVVLAADRYDDLARRLPAGQITVWAEPGRAGARWSFEVGRVPDLAAAGVTGVGSIEVPAWLSAVLHDQPAGAGNAVTYVDDVADTGAWKATARSLTVRRELASLRVPAGWEAWLFQDGGCRGRALKVTADTAVLASVWTASQPPRSLLVLDMRHRNQERALVHTGPLDKPGTTWCFDVGGVPDLSRIPLEVASIDFAPDARVTFYAGPERTGAAFVWDKRGPVLDLEAQVPLDAVGSFALASPGPVTLYAEPNLGGRSWSTVTAGFDRLAVDLTQLVSALDVPPGLRVTLYENTGFRGRALACEGLVDGLDGFAPRSMLVGRAPEPPIADPNVGGLFASTPGLPDPADATTKSFAYGTYRRSGDKLGPFSDSAAGSIWLRKGCRLTFFEGADFNGPSRAVAASRSRIGLDLKPYKSALVTHVLGEGEDCAVLWSGLSEITHLGFGQYPGGSFLNGGDLSLAPGFAAVLFEKPGFQGMSAVVAGDMGINGNISVGSVRLIRRPLVFGVPAALAQHSDSGFGWPRQQGAYWNDPPPAGLGLTITPPATDIVPPAITFGDAKLTHGTWHHLAVTRAGSMWTQFVDGRPLGPPSMGDADPLAGGFRIGDFFTGLIGCVAVRRGAKDPATLARERYVVPDTSDPTLLAAWVPVYDGAQKRFFDEVKSGTPTAPADPRIVRASYPRPVQVTAAVLGVKARTDAHRNAQLSVANAAAAALKRKAARKTMLDTRGAQNEAAARVAAGRLEAVWRIERGQVAAGGLTGAAHLAPPLDPAREVTALCADVKTQTLYLASRDSAGAHCSLWKCEPSAAPVKVRDVDSTVHVLAFEPRSRALFWIEHPDRLRRHGLQDDSLTEVRLPVGADGTWSICLEDLDFADTKKTRLYWGNGREIWRAVLTDAGALTDAALYVSHGQSLRPVALVVDDTFDEAKDTTRGKLFWVDRELALVRSIDGGGRIHDLYPAPAAREALAVDMTLERLYWNAEHRALLETAVIDDPGLFYWFEDRGETGARHQHIEVLEDLRERDVAFDVDADPAARIESAGRATWARLPGDTPRRSLLFRTKEAVPPNPATHSYVTLGPLYLDCAQGFTAEAVVRFDDTGPAAPVRLFDLGNGPAHLNIRLGRDAAGGFRFQLCNPGHAAEASPSLVGGSAPPKKWLHVVATVDAKGLGSLYVDGVKAAPKQLAVPATGARRLNYLGRGNVPDDGSFVGRIAMLRLWNLCLDEDAAKQSYVNPFRELTEPDNPFGVFDTHLLRYHRSMIEHRDGRVWLMSGTLDGEWPAVPLFEMAADASLILQSAALAAHQELIQAHYDRARAQAQREADLIAAEKARDDRIETARRDLTTEHATADQKIADASATAATRRSDAAARQRAETDKQRQRVAAQEAAARTAKANASRDAEKTEADARAARNRRVDAANAKLAEARKERAKH